MALREAVATNGEMELTAAAAALERADRRRCWGWWQIALVVAVALLSLPLLAHSLWQFKQLVEMRGYLTFPGIGKTHHIADLTPRQELLLYGARGASRESGRWKPLWDSAPENPAYLARYATAYFQNHSSLSPEILDAASRIDPGNGWFAALHAAGTADGAVTKEQRPYSAKKRSPADPAPAWKIDDPARLRTVLDGIHRFTAEPRFSSNRTVLFAEQLPLLPARRDFIGQLPGFYFSASQPSPSIHFRKLADAMSAGAQQAAAAGDVAEFHRIATDWRVLSRLFAVDSSSVIDGLVARAVLTSPLLNLRDGAKALGLEEEAAAYGDFHARLLAEKEVRDKRPRPQMEEVSRKGSTYASITLPMLARQASVEPAVSEADLQPGR